VLRVFERMAAILREDDTITIHGFGKFALVDRAARQGRNPMTGEPVSVPERKTVKFFPSKILLGEIRGKN